MSEYSLVAGLTAACADTYLLHVTKKVAQNDPAVRKAVSKVSEALGDTGRILVRVNPARSLLFMLW